MKVILFTEILFNKTIKKEKTMTRRAGKSFSFINEHPDDWCLMDMYGGYFRNMRNGDEKFVKPRYKVGEVVYIKEPVAMYRYKEYHKGVVSDVVVPAYKYGLPQHQAIVYMPDGAKIIPNEHLVWKNKMFVGSDKARYYIRITNVKIERLYDISKEDCLKEGVDELLIGYGAVKLKGYPLYDSKNGETTISIRRSFFSLFRFANKVPKSKEIPNIWCFAYSYVLCDKEGNEL